MSTSSHHSLLNDWARMLDAHSSSSSHHRTTSSGSTNTVTSSGTPRLRPHVPKSTRTRFIQFSSLSTTVLHQRLLAQRSLLKCIHTGHLTVPDGGDRVKDTISIIEQILFQRDQNTSSPSIDALSHSLALSSLHSSSSNLNPISTCTKPRLMGLKLERPAHVQVLSEEESVRLGNLLQQRQERDNRPPGPMPVPQSHSMANGVSQFKANHASQIHTLSRNPSVVKRAIVASSSSSSSGTRKSLPRMSRTLTTRQPGTLLGSIHEEEEKEEQEQEQEQEQVEVEAEAVMEVVMEEENEEMIETSEDEWDSEEEDDDGELNDGLDLGYDEGVENYCPHI